MNKQMTSKRLPDINQNSLQTHQQKRNLPAITLNSLQAHQQKGTSIMNIETFLTVNPSLTAPKMFNA